MTTITTTTIAMTPITTTMTRADEEGKLSILPRHGFSSEEDVAEERELISEASAENPFALNEKCGRRRKHNFVLLIFLYSQPLSALVDACWESVISHRVFDRLSFDIHLY